MTEKTSLLFRDPDGGFALVRPLGERRARVVLSSVFAEGDVVYLPGSLSWEGAAESNGIMTRLGPRRLVLVESEPEDLELEAGELRMIYEMLEEAD